MAERVRLTAADGHELEAYRAAPDGARFGSVVIVQEIFGLTAHILRMVDRYAEAGFAAVAPAMFDRLERGLVLDYTEVQRGRDTMARLQWPQTLADVQAALDLLDGTKAVLGYCWGGTVAHVAAAELDLDAAVSYYGGAVARMLDKVPRCPIMYHFGDQDHAIPSSEVDKIRRAVPDAIVHVYAGAQHGFNCEDRASFSAPDAAVAFERSTAFLRRHLA